VSAQILEKLKAHGWLKQQNLIGGVWRDANSGKRYDVIDPATGAVIGTIPWSGAAETKAAIEAAHSAFKTWSRTLASTRADILHKMAAILRDNAEELASMLTLEQGKPLAEARIEVQLSAGYF
jgi:succinate-semialdehyde dehydrogenase/glutarate-semialdehyde dehydrogenase